MADHARPKTPEGPEGMTPELVGLPAGVERPPVLVQALGAKNEGRPDVAASRLAARMR